MKSRTCCVFNFACYPITWFIRLYTEKIMSTKVAECIALSIAAKEILPLRELLVELKTILDIPEAELKIF